MSVSLINEGIGVAVPYPCRVAFCQFGYAVDNDVRGVAQATYELFAVPADTYIVDVIAYTITAWTTSVTMDIGDGTDTDGFLKTATVAPTTAQTDGLVKRQTKAANSEAYAVGKLYTAADTIDAVIGGATPAAGRTYVWVLYIPNATDRYTVS
jgi:hypothetical protein